MLKFSKLQWLESNFWKLWLYIFTNRRAYIPLLWIYFLTFPDNTIKQIGLYTAIWSLTSFLFEIPSGYFSDRFWHKKTLILAKIFMFCSTLCFLIWKDVVFFTVWSVFLSLGFSFTSGTMSAFVHENMVELKISNLFTKIWSRMQGSVSLFNALLIVAIPFLTNISFKLPFVVWLWMDIVWLIVAFSFVNTINDKGIKKSKNIFKVINETRWTKFWSVAIFVIVSYGIISSNNAFRWPYLQSIGYPVAYIGFVMWMSRVIWFLVSRFAHWIENNFSIKKLLFVEIFIFSFLMFGVSFIKNPYIVWVLLSLMMWYYWWRESIVQNFLINSLPDKKYKATMLSVNTQMTNLLNLVLVFILGYIMSYSYSIWFLFLAWLLFVGLMISWIFVKRIK